MLKMLRRIKNSRKGFTLIELIIVIAILGVLATILVPTMLGIVNDAQESVNLANARSTYSVAQAIYVQWEVSGKSGDIASASDASVPSDAFKTAVASNMGADFDIADYTIVLETASGKQGVKSVTYNSVTYP